MTKHPNGTLIYTPFPEMERTVPTSGAQTDRNHYAIAGQLIAVQVKPKDQAGVFYYQFNDRLGSVAAMRRADGTWVNNNRAHYTAYGSYAVKPSANVNPGISDRGFTGHRHNNTGTNDLGLIYMNARYYMPEIGRFISPDAIVPEPTNPQSYNRYSYVLNSPVNYTDPSGHRECLAPDGGCGRYVNSWESAAANYRTGQDIAFGPTGTNKPQLYGNFHLGPVNFSFDAESSEIIDLFFDIGIGGYATILGGEVGKEFSLGDPNFEGPWYGTVGEGIGLQIIGLGIEVSRSVTRDSANKISMEYDFTAFVLGVRDGLSFDANSIIFRPSDRMASFLTNGDESTWLALGMS